MDADDLAELVDDLLDALRESDPDWDNAWAEEAKRRMDAYRRGEVKGIPAEEGLRRLGKP